MLTLTIIMIFNTLLFFTLNHPLSMGLLLLIQTLTTALITGLMNLNFLYSYMLFLILIGGMLILFIYMTSVASNEKFKFNTKFKTLMILMSSMIMTTLMMDHFYLSLKIKIMDLELNNLMLNFNYSMQKFFNFPTFILMMTLISYLFLSLIAIVKITKTPYGTLRKNF